MDLQLENSTAIVVGGAQGIGLAIGQAFAAERANVALIDINELVYEAAKAIGNQSNSKSLGIQCDATDYSRVCDMASTIVRQLPGQMHLIYAAGCGSGKYGFPFWNLQPSDWQRVLDVNLLGAVNTAHAFASTLMESRSGTILFLSSVAGQIGSQTDPPYSAAKAGLINFAQCAAKDFAEYNVRVNVLCPGMVQTEINRSVWMAWNQRQPESSKMSYDDWGQNKVRMLAPLGRWQTPEDMAQVAVFLASDRAKNITGQTINVDGGQVMHS